MSCEPTEKFLLTKILATLGPASSEESTVTQMVEAGVRCFRLNFSHGSFSEHRRSLENVRKASEKTGIPVGVLGDLCGPKIRLGKLAGTGVTLERGMRVEFNKSRPFGETGSNPGSATTVLSTTYPGFIEEVNPGERILLDDGKLELTCLEKRGVAERETLICEVIRGGQVISGKGINLPDTRITVPALTDKDRESVRFAVENGVDYLALSFVRSAQDVVQLNDCIRQLGAESQIPVISKIEKPQALEQIEAILDVSDGIMVARGDLGVEMDLAEVPVIQKKIIRLCHDYGKPAIVATQMLESMIESPTPTRAEVSDVANAIFDGTDAVMLSGETAVGRWPVESVQVMNRVASCTNAFLKSQPLHIAAPRKLRESKYRTAALAHGVSTIVRDLDAKLIVMWATLDRSALYLSRYRLSRPILAFSANPIALRRMCIGYGLTPLCMEEPASAGEFICRVDALLMERGWVDRGDPIVFVFGEPIGQPEMTNRLSVHYVGDASDFFGHQMPDRS